MTTKSKRTAQPKARGESKDSPSVHKGDTHKKQQKHEPTKRETQKQILVAEIEAGTPVAAACARAGCDRATYYRWKQSDATFATAIKNAELVRFDIRIAAAEDAIIAAFDTAWQSAAWWLERNAPDRYGLKAREMASAFPYRVRGVNV